MAASATQYHHYIPRFILKRFAHTDIETKSSKRDGLLHVFNLSNKQFHLGEVGKTCGTQNLYYNASDLDPMRIEHLFSKLESRTSAVFAKISAAIDEGQSHIDILEKDVRILFQFMNLSFRRSAQDRDEMENPCRENDFMFQRLFETSRNHGRAADPGQLWLEHLLYLLQTSHEDILADAEKTDDNLLASTYKHFVESYALQIWKAADGYEFFLNERLIDFEGDTQSYLGTEITDSGPRLIWMTADDLIHLVLPISPDVAVIFCNESRCWESPFAESMHRLKIAYPDNSLSKNAPHKDIIDVQIPNVKRGKKRWPAFVAWRVNIGTLSRDHHQILTSYSLGHAKKFVIVRRRARFERAIRESKAFNNKRIEVWKSQGIRFGSQDLLRQHSEEDKLPHLSPEQSTRIVDDHMSALAEMLNRTTTTDKPLRRTKDNTLKSWMAVCSLEAHNRKSTTTSSSTCDTDLSHLRGMHPALKAAFEAAYPPQSPAHRDLVTIDFGQFFSYGISEEMFVELTSKIDSKIVELVRDDNFHTHWEACTTSLKLPDQPLLSSDKNRSEQENQVEKDLLKNPAFQSFFRAAQDFEVLKWMFEQRQDILATFVRQLAVPMEAMQPKVTRIRPARK